MVFCAVAVLYCVQRLAGTKRNNQIFYQANLEDTPVHRKSSYINRIFGSRQYAEEVKLCIHQIQEELADNQRDRIRTEESYGRGTCQVF